MVNQHTKFQKYRKRAFALLFAMFVSSIMLSIGLGISNVIYKELVLSGIGRESEYSLYNAQSGLECALHLNQTDPGFFATASGQGSGTPGSTCDGAAVTGISYNVDPTAGATTTFQFNIQYLPPNPQMCAQVEVFKSANNYMTVESRGYNTPCTDLVNPRRVERSLKLRTNIVAQPGP